MAEVKDSILDSVKKKLGLASDYDVFDLDIVDGINTAFANLHQLGIGPDAGFEIEDANATWDTFLGAQASPVFNSVKSYVVFKTRLAWDPPGTSFHIAAIEKQISELEFRLSVARDEMLFLGNGVTEPVLPEEPVVVAPVDPVPEPVQAPIMADVDGGGADMG